MVMMVSVRFVTVLVFFVRMRMPVFMVAVISATTSPTVCWER